MTFELWWNGQQVTAWVYTRNEKLVGLLSDHQEPRSRKFELIKVELEDGSIECKEREIEPKQYPSSIDFIAMSLRPGAEFESQAEANFDIRRKLQAGDLACWGRSRIGGRLKRIPLQEWADLDILFRLDASDECDAVAITEATKGVVQAPIWFCLRFKSAEVVACWPLPGTESVPEPAQSRVGQDQDVEIPDELGSPATAGPYRTGLPGRPTARHLLTAEFKRRVDSKMYCESLLDEAKALHAWLKEEHPNASPATVPEPAQSRVGQDQDVEIPDELGSPATAGPYRTGLPGRPTARHLLTAEFKRRVDSKMYCESLLDEAKALHAWLKEEHPNASPATVKTIENHIRKAYRRAKAPHTK